MPGLARPTTHTQLKTLPGRLELPTLRLTASRSNQLSYGSARASFEINGINKANPNTRCTIRCHRSPMCWCKLPLFRCQKRSGAVRVVDGHTAALFPGSRCPVGRGPCVSAAKGRRGSNSRPWEYNTYTLPTAQQSTEKHGNTLKSSRTPFVPLTFLLILPVSYPCPSFAASRCRSGSVRGSNCESRVRCAFSCWARPSLTRSFLKPMIFCSLRGLMAKAPSSDPPL